MKTKLKNIILVSIAFILIGFGYFNFHAEKDSFDIAIDNNEKTGDVELVNSTPVDESLENEIQVENEEKDENNNDYFSESRIDRDKRYSQMIETYQKIIDSSEISSDQKGIALEEIKKIENQKNGILVSENLIRNKGFDDVVIFINENSVSCVVKSNITLLKESVAQIQNIISRELNVKIENINISNKEK